MRNSHTLNIRLRRIHRGSATLKAKPLQPPSLQRERREKEEEESQEEIEMELEDIADDAEEYYLEDPSNIG